MALQYRAALAFVVVWIVAPAPISAQQLTTGFCSPAISNVTGDVTTNCFLTRAEWHQSVADNLQETVFELRRLTNTQMFFLIPSMNEYVNNPSPATWSATKRDADLVRKRLAFAIDAAVRYDSSLEQGLGPDLREVYDALRSRDGLLSELPEDPPSVSFVREWASRYRKQIEKLTTQLCALSKRLRVSKEPR